MTTEVIVGKKKKKIQFIEPAGGWSYHPDGAACINCEKVTNPICAFYHFESMRVIDIYEGHKVVKCTERVVKEIPITQIHGKEYVTEFILKFMRKDNENNSV